MPVTALELLTEREKQIMYLIREGYTYSSTGQKLLISPQTVKKHLQHIYRKLEVGNKIEAINKLRWKK